MEWINIHVSTLDSETFLDAEPADRATWLMLLRYCVGQENGGRIVSAKAWSDRKWQQVAAVTLREVNRDCRLWRWEGDDISVEFYPLRKQQEVQTKRKAGVDTANKRWHQHQQPPATSSNPDQATCSADSSAIGSATSSNPDQATCSGVEKRYAEGKGREGNNTPLPPKGGVGRGEGRSPCSETHTDEEVMSWATQWLGEPASGTPPMPQDYVVHWLAMANQRSRVMANWQRALVAAWRKDWRTWNVNGAAGVIAAARPVSPEMRRLDITRQIEAVKAAIEKSPANSMGVWNAAEPTDEDRQKLAKMRTRKKELEAALLEASL